ncbi:MAG: antibiotic biosynthesis monooxygenase [Proteobacteria bacterium]|nr:antibiotic biosynthesis monooxygenase [Pseudomonadota bacterium]
MLALFFEFQPLPGCLPRYLEIAGKLRPSLLQSDGFLFIDRFQSLSRPAVYLSHSLWRDEAAIARWRSFEPHFSAQVEARESILVAYRLRISSVFNAQDHLKAVYDQKPGKPTVVLQFQYRRSDPSSETSDRRETVIADAPMEVFQSLNHPDWLLTLESSPMQAREVPRLAMDRTHGEAGPPGYPGLMTAHLDRDYSMHERSEAPQFHRSCPIRRF